MAVAAKQEKDLFKRVEEALYSYPQMKKEIQMIRDNIMFCKDEVDENVGGGRASLPGKPTERIATRLVTNKHLERLERVVEAIEDVYHSLPDEYKQLIRLRYWTSRKYRWESKYTWERIANELHVGRRTVFRMREEIIEAIAKRLER
ncbi:transcriptional regulator [Thermaerobacillus caldiproteolyticus]|uniref:transcriptional regulator n=1 Tax=Thermaerobacillus caldiproteolyticus TaxID=247480 RepID=UPI0018F16230|nr:transcriptional regulator [Anoxybacillus caldiproteolyticus]